MYVIINKDDEVWKPLTSYDIEPKYEISNYGNIRTIKSHNLITPYICKDGYIRVILRKNNEKKKRPFLVHRLVAFTFVHGYNPESGKVIVNHKDSDRSNAYYENLEWITFTENVRHGFEHGHIFKYNEPKSVVRKYNEDLIHSICGYLECGYTPSRIYEILGSTCCYSKKNIVDLIHRLKTTRIKIYEDVTQYYNIPTTIRQVTLSEDVVRKICSLLEKSYYTEDIIRELNIPPEQVNKYRKNICDIKYYRTFCNISKDYTFPYDIYTKKSKFPYDAIVDICEKLENNVPMTEIVTYITSNYCTNHTKTRDFIYDIKRRRIHTNISSNYLW